MSAQKEPSSAPNLKNSINELWPGFKYLGFGLYLAWLLLICDEADLSPREREIFALLSTGHTAEAIANELSISANTVRTHVHNIYGKLDVHSRQELIDLVKSHI